jgi:hypothetical protein
MQRTGVRLSFFYLMCEYDLLDWKWIIPLQLLKTFPGIGDMLAIVIEREVGSISRFPSASAAFRPDRGRLPSGPGSVRPV